MGNIFLFPFHGFLGMPEIEIPTCLQAQNLPGPLPKSLPGKSTRLTYQRLLLREFEVRTCGIVPSSWLDGSSSGLQARLGLRVLASFEQIAQLTSKIITAKSWSSPPASLQTHFGMERSSGACQTLPVWSPQLRIGASSRPQVQTPASPSKGALPCAAGSMDG